MLNDFKIFISPVPVTPPPTPIQLAPDHFAILFNAVPPLAVNEPATYISLLKISIDSIGPLKTAPNGDHVVPLYLKRLLVPLPKLLTYKLPVTVSTLILLIVRSHYLL